VTFDFPSSQTIYDDFEFNVENVEVIPKGRKHWRGGFIVG